MCCDDFLNTSQYCTRELQITFTMSAAAKLRREKFRCVYVPKSASVESSTGAAANFATPSPGFAAESAIEFNSPLHGGYEY